MSISEIANDVLFRLNNNLEHLMYCKVFGFPLFILIIALILLYINIVLVFPSIRFFKKSIHIIKTKPKGDDPGDITPSQAIMTAALGNIGFGSVAGVAIAITYGGIGSLFWMIVFAFFGMTMKFCEVALGVKYREIDGENIQGGPFYYLKKGLKEIGHGKLGIYFAFIYGFCLLFCAFIPGGLFQMNQNAMIFRDTFSALNTNPHIMAVICVLIVGSTLVGGAKYVAKLGEIVIPPLTIGYIFCVLIIVLMNINNLGSALLAIVGDAFNNTAIHGGIIGGIIGGATRAMFATEFGAGTSAIAHCRAKTDHHIKAGFVSFIELLLVLLVATMTGLAIVLTGVYENLGVNGVIMTRDAFLTIHHVFQYIFPFMCFLLAITTVIAWGYYGEMSWNFVFKNKASYVFKILFLITIYFGSVTESADEVIRLTEYSWNMMTLPNVIAIAMLIGMIKKDIKNYEQLNNN